MPFLTMDAGHPRREESSEGGVTIHIRNRETSTKRAKALGIEPQYGYK